MDYNTLKTIMENVKGTKFASIDTTSDVKLKGGKSNPFKDRVKKKTTGSTVIVSNSAENVYANMVKTRLIEEGKDFTQFQLKPRAWGVREGDTSIIDHNGKKYLECIFIKSGKSVYLVDGVETDPETIDGLELDKKVNEESQGGLENKIIIRTFSADSIDEIRINGEAHV